MSQNVFNTIDPTLVGGTELASILDNFKNALMSGLSGPNRPSQLQAGGFWIDTLTPNRQIFKIYNGTTDATVFTVNTTTSTVSIQGSDDFFEVTKISEDAVAPYVSFLKRRTTGNGQVKAGDVVGEIDFRAGSDSVGTNYLIGRIRYVALNDISGANQGGYFVIEGVRKDTAALTEFARFYNGRLAIGLNEPTHAIHVRSSTGIKNERVTDDSSGPKDTMGKSRVSGGGQVLSGDVLGEREFSSKDGAGTEFVAASIVASADEDHTPTNRGTRVAIRSINKGSNVIEDRVVIAEGKMDMKVTIVQEALDRKIQSVASVADLPNLDAQRSFIEITGATAMTLRGILSTSKSKSFDLYNGTTQNIIIVNQDAGVPAEDRIAVNGEMTLTLPPGKTVTVQRRTATNMWHTLVEGTTGITFNEATTLIAKMVANSFFPDTIPSPYQANNGAGTTIPDYLPDIVYGVAANPTGMAVIAYTPSLGVGIYLRNHRGLTWGGNRSASSDYAVDLPGTEWVRAVVFHDSGMPNLLAVRPLGTARAVAAKLNAPTGISNFPHALLFNPNISSASEWTDVATDGSVILAVARAGTNRVGKVAATTSAIMDGTLWTYTTNAVIDVPLRSIAFGGGRWVAVGGYPPGGSLNHSAWVSTNSGSTWTSYAMPSESTVFYNLVRYCNSQFVAAGFLPGGGMSLLTSPDGQAWTQRATTAPGVTIMDIAFGGGLYIAYTDQNTALISTDGVNWMTVTSLPVRTAKFVSGYGFISTPYISSGPVIYRTPTPSF